MPLKEFASKYFVGRSSEIDRLQSIAAQASHGDSGSIILFGKRGMGKTELLRHLFSDLFNGQSNTIPFLYTVNTAFDSIEEFSKDYLSSFINQSLAFIKKDFSLIHANVVSLEDLRDIAHKSEALWAADIIDNFLHITESGKPVNVFSSALSAPSRCYRTTGMPVVTLLDDFHKIKKMSEFMAGDFSKDIWMCFDNALRFQYAPHVIAGCKADLHRMFFEETSFGEHLELMNLPGLGRNDAFGLFSSLCRKHALDFDDELINYIDLFRGNPFYIKSFVQAARHASRYLNEDNFWEIYVGEITGGKIATYWTSILKRYITRFEQRKPALQVLYNLIVNNAADVYERCQDMFSIDKKELDNMIDILYMAGAIEMGFSTLEFTDDTVLADVMKGLYHKEMLGESSDQIRDVITGDKRKTLTESRLPSFDITIPSAPKAELIAVHSLEQIARYYNMPPDMTGQMQVALVELFSGSLGNGGVPGESYELKFILKDNMFSAEILTSHSDLVLSDDDNRRIRLYVDDLSVEKVMEGSRITLIKKLKEDLASAS
jgi:hypothetical protein